MSGTPNMLVVAFLGLVCIAGLTNAGNFKRVKDSVHSGQSVQAGAAKKDATLIGIPLAGYNHGPRRVPYFPLPEFTEYTTFMTPSTGALDPNWVKALVLVVGDEEFVFVTLDGIGADGTLARMAHDIAASQGFPIPFSSMMMSGSHSHSGPGAVSSEMLWTVAPATDVVVPKVQRWYASAMADAMLEAYANLQDATIGAGSTDLLGVTVNRRAKISPYVTSGTIDPHLGVLGLRSVASGKPIATLWNFAIHGVCYGPDNLKFSSDIMGYACDLIEEQIGGVALFVNGDAGDIDPAPSSCDSPPAFRGSPLMATAVVDTAAHLEYSAQAYMKVASRQVDFGPTDLNYTLSRFNNCTSGGTLDICTLCSVLRCDLNVHMPSGWVENSPIFTAIRLSIAGNDTVIVSVPGEALVELGWWIRNDTAALGFDHTFIAGYSQSHMGYFAPPDEYDIGGYESQLTLWGITTAEQVRAGCKSVASLV